MVAFISELSNWWLNTGYPILLFVIGLGLVVFIHELGHFLAAKKVGIKVERFAFGFGPRLFGIRWGETDYCVNLIPLGGYIKMLGQEDFRPLEENEQVDPRSFEAKTVGQRFLVISAGVVMNVVLAAVLFVIVGMVGITFSAPVIGYVAPDSPASKVQFHWTAAGAQPAADPEIAATQPANYDLGLQPGDLVVRLDGEDVNRFKALEVGSLLASSEDSQLDITIERTDPDGKIWVGQGKIGVAWDAGHQRLIFGVTPAADVVFGEFYKVDIPFLPGDQLLEINGHPIKNSWDSALTGNLKNLQPVEVSVLREGKRVSQTVTPTLSMKNDVVWLDDGQIARLTKVIQDKDGKPLYQATLTDGSTRDLPENEVVLEPLDILGMVPRTRIAAVSKDSPADKAQLKDSPQDRSGLQEGDVIIGYGDRSNPSLSEIQEINRKQAGQKTEISVLRNGETKTLWVAPKDRGEANGKRRVEMGIFPSSDTNHLILAAVRANSPAARAGLKSGDVLESANGQPVNNWRDLFTVVESAQGKPLKLTYLRGSQQATAELGVITPEVFQLSHYQCDLVPIDGLKPLSVTIHKSNPVEAMAWGLKETWDWLVINYATLRALVGRTVDTSALSGPLGMGKAAMDIGREGSLNQFVYFIALISAALAVFNFLPLPVVDGGYAVMLLLEKIRGKPLSVKLTNIIQFTGLALLLVVFILLTWQDAVRIWQGMW